MKPAEAPPIRTLARATLSMVGLAEAPAVQLRWVATVALFSLWPLPGYALPQTLLALGLGVAASLRGALPARVSAAAGVVGAGYLGALVERSQLGGPFSPLALGPGALLAAGFVGGALALRDEKTDRHTLVQGGLLGALGMGLGAWAAVQLTGGLSGPLAMGLLALLASAAVFARALRWSEVSRPESVEKVEAALALPYRVSGLRAAALDAEIERRAPDLAARDGLGEVAAWVIRLQWTTQELDRDIAQIDLPALDQRLTALTAELDQTEDPFTRERKRATISHLNQLLGHRGALLRERDRAGALSDYALAFLEEARAGLAVARLTPGDHVPNSLPDVLDRLRTFSAEQEVQRRGARELSFALPQP